MMPPQSRRPIIKCDNMIAHLIAYEGRGAHFRSAEDVVRRLLKQAVLHQAEWKYGNQEQINNILRKRWSRWWRRKIDGIGPLEYSFEFVQHQPLEALRGIPLALARAAQGYLLWYQRNSPQVTVEQVRQEFNNWTSDRAYRDIMVELFGKPFLT